MEFQTNSITNNDFQKFPHNVFSRNPTRNEKKMK
jgi:hypothetical protein